MEIPQYNEETPQYIDDTVIHIHDDITIQYDDSNHSSTGILRDVEDGQITTLYTFLSIVGFLVGFALIVTWVFHRYKVRRQKYRQIKVGIKSQSNPPQEELRGVTKI